MEKITINGKTYEHGKRYYNADLLSAWVSTDRDGAQPSSIVLQDNQDGYEYTEIGEIDGNKAMMSYIVSDAEIDACEDDLGNIDWESCKDSVMVID